MGVFSLDALGPSTLVLFVLFLTAVILYLTLTFGWVSNGPTSQRSLQKISLPLIALLYVSFFVFRYTSQSSALFLGESGEGVRVGATFIVFSVVAIGLFAVRTPVCSTSWNAESLIGFWFLPLIWFWAFNASSFFSIIILLELGGVVTVLTLTSLFFSYRGVETTNVLFMDNGRLNTNTWALTQALLIFLWSSAFALLGMLWVFAEVSKFTGCFNVVSYLASSIESSAQAYLIGYLFFIAILLKLMFFPFQTLMFSFYKHMPINLFSFYLCFYYTGFLMVAVLLLSASVSVLISAQAFLMILIISSLGATLQLLFKNSYDVRGVFAVSSTVNIMFILILGLLSL